MADFTYAFEPRTEDLDVELEVEGTLPDALRGRFYAIGGTGCRVGETPLHLLDAHGRVFSVHVDGGKASLRARMVQTPLWEAERGASSIQKRRLFQNKPKRWSNLFDVDLANPAGHDVVPWGDALVATNDPGFFSLDPETLATRGPTPIQPKKGANFGPMVRRDPATGRRIVFEVRPGLRDTLIVREIDDAFRVHEERTYALPRGGSFFHDVAFTANHYLVMQFGAVSVPKLLWGAVPVADAVGFDPATTPVLHALPRAGGAPVTIPLPGGRVHFHFWNAFERDDRLVVDAIGYDGKVGFELLVAAEGRHGAAPPTPRSASWRYTIDVARKDVRAEKLVDMSAEAPAIRADRRGRAYRYGWAPVPGGAGDEEDRGAFTWYHALARHDFEERTTDVWDAGPRAYVSPVAFVPESGADAEDAGHLLAWIQDAEAKAAHVAVFDARRVAAGPVARLRGAPLLGALSHVAFA